MSAVKPHPAGQDTRPRAAAFNMFEPGFMADPLETILRLHRDAPPVFYDDSIGCWIVTRYRDIASGLKDWRVFSSRALGRVTAPADLLPRVPAFANEEIIAALDPPDHTLARLTMQRGFTAKIVESMADPTHEIANQFIDQIIARGECNFITDFCYAFTLGLITHLLNLPPEHAEDYKRWGNSLFGILVPQALDDTEIPDAIVQARAAVPEAAIRKHWENLAEANAFLGDLLKQRERAPKDDMVSAFLQARDAKGKIIDRGAVVRHMLSLFTAGHDTSANMIAHLVLLLTDNPDQLALLKSDPSLLRNTVEEGLRRRGSSTGAFRVATEDTELGGQKLPRGSLVCLLLPGGSLDSEIFPDPGRFDINRPNANKHLALGFGLHACIGQPLVRMETPIAIRELYRRMPDLHIDRAMPMAYTPTFGFSGLNQITARWTPG